MKFEFFVKNVQASSTAKMSVPLIHAIVDGKVKQTPFVHREDMTSEIEWLESMVKYASTYSIPYLMALKKYMVSL